MRVMSVAVLMVIVSNPLRLEGDGDGDPHARAVQGFLIHYGWRETFCEATINARTAEFLIHYGWRETGYPRCPPDRP